MGTSTHDNNLMINHGKCSAIKICWVEEATSAADNKIITILKIIISVILLTNHVASCRSTSVTPSAAVQTQYAIECCGLMVRATFKAIYHRSVVIAKITYNASSAWRGFSLADDHNHINALRRSDRCGMCSLDLLTFEKQCRLRDANLFHKLFSCFT